jgi:transcriptional regulator with XRE-family HTH domain
VSHFESGSRKPSFDNLKRLAGALNVTTDYLLGRSDTPDTSGTSGRLHRDQHKLSAEDLTLTEEFVGDSLTTRVEADDDNNEDEEALIESWTPSFQALTSCFDRSPQNLSLPSPPRLDSPHPSSMRTRAADCLLLGMGVAAPEVRA